jgi:hypothetical protein
VIAARLEPTRPGIKECVMPQPIPLLRADGPLMVLGGPYDAEPGAFETVRQNLGHSNTKTTTGFYAGINSRRAGRHHYRLIQQALQIEAPKRGRKKRAS